MCLPDGSRMNREVHVRFCEGLWGRFPRSTLQSARRDLWGLELPISSSFYPIGILYLNCSDLTCTAKDIEIIYKKRWGIEVFHKTIKSNTALAKSPTKVPLTQGNHVFMSIYSAFKLECLSLKYKMNHFALKAKLYMTVIRQAFDQLRSLW